MSDEKEKEDMPKIRLVIEIEKPQEKSYPSHNELLDKEKGFYREPGDWFKEE